MIHLIASTVVVTLTVITTVMAVGVMGALYIAAKANTINAEIDAVVNRGVRQ